MANAPIFFLIAVRAIAFVFTIPLFSMRATPRAAKIVFAGYLAFFLMGSADLTGYNISAGSDSAFNLWYLLLVLGEGMIGVILGLLVSMVFAIFSTAGQLFAFQMGFSAASAYDSLSQVENPLMGQYLNLVAMLMFLNNGYFQELVLVGFCGSVKNFNIFRLITHQNDFVELLFKGLGALFTNAFIIAIPIIASMFFISICMGLLSKAAPQMNLLSEGFPIMILVSFGILAYCIPTLCNLFANFFGEGIMSLGEIFPIPI